MLLAFPLSLVSGASAAGGTPAPTAAGLQQLEDQGLRQIIIGRAPGLSPSARADIRDEADVDHVANLRLADTEVVRAEPGGLVEAVRALEADPGVLYAEPDVEVHALSNDPQWSSMWALQNTGQTVSGRAGTPGDDIDVLNAWALSIGAGQTVAVVDTGATFAHADLQGAYATNPGETGADGNGNDKASNGLDDDNDGYADDARGWDFVNCTGSCTLGPEGDPTPGPDNDPNDGNGHGTHVAGTIAARRDNAIGVTGVAPGAKVFPLRALSSSGSGSASWIANAFDLAGDLGIRVVNASVGGSFSSAEQHAIAAHPETLYVVAAGNGGGDGSGDDNDLANPATQTYPCAFPETNVVCVGATDANDARAPFSNYGAHTVDLFAPGVNVVSTLPGAPGYAFWNGTSMATPHVAATIALMRTMNPLLTAAQLKAALLAGVHPVAGLAGRSVSGGRLDAAAAVAAAAPDPADPDRDGVRASADNCPNVANPAQSDADGDRIGDVCDTTPFPTTVVPVVGAPAPAGPPTGGAGTARRVAAPVLGRVRVSAGALTAGHPLAVRFTLDRAATTRIAIQRRAGHGYRAAATVRVTSTRGSNRYLLRTRIGTRRLRAGRYRIVLQAVSGTRRSRTATVRVAVH